MLDRQDDIRKFRQKEREAARLLAGRLQLEEKAARVFNLGCDARLRGLSVRSCPTSFKDHWAMARWRQGWYDVEYNWGIHVVERWNFEPLPTV